MCLCQSIFSAWPDFLGPGYTSVFYPFPYRAALLAHLQSHFPFLADCGLDLDSEWAEDFSLKDI